MASKRVRNAPYDPTFTGWMVEVKLVHHRGDPNKLPPIEISGREFISDLELQRLRLGSVTGLRSVLDGVGRRVLSYLLTKYDFNGRVPVPVETPAPAPRTRIIVPPSPSGEHPDGSRS
jgi:hypothetical protein